ncbi:maleylacetate reductase [Bipolaris maydis]|nr:maleylacetate reductase [Bipolaris maydis]
MDTFTYTASPRRVIFGSGLINKLLAEIEMLKCAAPLLLSSARHRNLSDQLAGVLHGSTIKLAGTFNGAIMHTPTVVTENAVQCLKIMSADCVISVGGGSVVGLGKAVSVCAGVPHLAVPTTFSWSEMTPILGETQEGRKTTRSGPSILPSTVIYDVDLSMSVPPSTCTVSGINAMAHANCNPIISMWAHAGIKSLAESLPQIVADPSAKPARKKARFGAWLCGMCLGSSTMALHHKLSMPRRTIVLPHPFSFNASAIPQQITQLAAALSNSQGDAILALNSLLDKLGAPRALRDLGMLEEDINRAADIAMSNQYENPRALERDSIRELIRRAWSGEDARVARLCK